MIDNQTLTVIPSATAGGADRPVGMPGFEILDEIGHGGMGVVYRARDESLGREVAVKLLQQRFAVDTNIVQRFLGEARITSQLQHPGIPAVHLMGTLSDGRPFLVMKLIKGRTLADLLRMRADPASERGRYFAVFEAVCQAVGYAHSHNVIHRDLKPSNVMVGAYGEVQVMDWGLAKVLDRSVRPTESHEVLTNAQELTRSVTTLDSPDSYTQAGRFLGTPAYAPPEQAAGELDKIDSRADVFGLGALLTVILTGHAPYRGKSAEVLAVQAIRGDLGECMERLDACGADPEWVALCKSCLAVDPRDRPQHAGAVAEAAARLRSAAEERAKQAEVDRVRAEGARVAAEIEARAQVRRRRTQAVVGLSFSALVVLGGLFAWRTQEQRRARENEERERTIAARAEVDRSIQEAMSAYGRAGASNRDPGLWAEARVAARQAATLAENASVPDEVRERIGRLVAEVEQSEKNRRLVETLLEIRASGGDTLMADGWMNSREVANRYESAFREYGADILAMAPADAAQLLIRLGGKSRVELAAAIDDWSFARHDTVGKFGELFPLSRLLDTDPTRNKVRELVERQAHAELCAYAETIDPAHHPAQTVNLISLYLYGLKPGGDVVSSRKLLTRAQPHHANDFFINKNLAWNMGRSPEARTYWMAALAIRPGSPSAWQGLAGSLERAGKSAEAEQARRRVRELAPNMAAIYRGNECRAQGDFSGAATAYREAIRLSPNDHGAYRRLGEVSCKLGDFATAEEAFRAGIRILSGDLRNHVGLAVVLYKQGRKPAADEMLQKVVNAFKNDPIACRDRADDFLDADLPDPALVLARAALAHQPNDPQTYARIGVALWRRGDHKDGVESLELALKHDANEEVALRQLAWVLATGPDRVRNGKRALELATRLCEKHGTTPFNLEPLAAAYAETGMFEQAVETQKKTLDLGESARRRLATYQMNMPHREAKP